MEQTPEWPVDTSTHHFRGFEWDIAHSRAEIYLTDGRSASMSLAVSASDDVGIARVLYSFEDHTLVITTPDGESATMELEPFAGTAQPAGRRIVYLDQGHWSALARRIHDPTSFPNQDDAAAADKIIGWARDRRIVLPLSSGHVVETAPLYGLKRRHLALTMLQLSRGWHMHNPLHVRRDEITWALADAGAITLTHDRPEVFTLDTDKPLRNVLGGAAQTGRVVRLSGMAYYATDFRSRELRLAHRPEADLG